MKLKSAMISVSLLLGMMAGMPSAQAARVADLTHLAGETPTGLQGYGLVVGLKGTGDGGDYLPAMKNLQQLLTKLGNPVNSVKDLKSSNNVAIVLVTASVPPQGARANQKLDVKISSLGAAKSLKGGRLLVTPLTLDLVNNGSLLGIASGDLTLEDDAQPTQAVIRAGTTGGATLLTDFIPQNVDQEGVLTLNLVPSAAGFANAAAIADQINEDVSPQTDGKAVATAVDAVTITVQIPKAERSKPAQFIARIQQLQIPPLPQVAKITINSKTKTIIFSGEVELTPTILSQGNMTITVTGANQAANPPGSQVPFVGIDPAKQGGAKFKDLLDSFNLLKVTPEDRISIIQQLHNSGALRCQLEVD